MDPINSTIDSNINNDDNKTEEMTLLVPNIQQLTLVSMQNELNEALNPFDVRRQRKSYDYQHDLPIARRPSDRRASNSSLFLEYVLHTHTHTFHLINKNTQRISHTDFYRRNL